MRIEFSSWMNTVSLHHRHPASVIRSQIQARAIPCLDKQFPSKRLFFLTNQSVGQPTLVTPSPHTTDAQRTLPLPSPSSTHSTEGPSKLTAMCEIWYFYYEGCGDEIKDKNGIRYVSIIIGLSNAPPCRYAKESQTDS